MPLTCGIKSPLNIVVDATVILSPYPSLIERGNKVQLDFSGKTKDQIAIERIQAFEPPEGYYLTHSGGKDSDCTLELCKMAGVKYDVHYSQTGIDPPELVYHMRKYHPEIIVDKPKMTIFKALETNRAPIRINRWCCRLLKEQHGEGRFLITGIRGEESIKRSERAMKEDDREDSPKMVQNCVKGKGKRFLHPIIDWTSRDVWNFIKERKLPYCELYDQGFKRLGCIGCPMGNNQRLIQFARYPKIKDAWFRAMSRYYELNKNTDKSVALFSSPLKYWDWWLQDKSVEEFTQDLPMFS